MEHSPVRFMVSRSVHCRVIHSDGLPPGVVFSSLIGCISAECRVDPVVGSSTATAMLMPVGNCSITGSIVAFMADSVPLLCYALRIRPRVEPLELLRRVRRVCAVIGKNEQLVLQRHCLTHSIISLIDALIFIF